MRFTLRKIYETTVVFLVACTILCASTLHPDVHTAPLVALVLLSAIAFLFLFFPPWERFTLFAVSIEFTILSVVLVVNIDDINCRRLDLVMEIAIGSYFTSNILLGSMVSLRGLLLKDMGIMGWINLAILDGLRVILFYVVGIAHEPDIEAAWAITA